MYIVGNAESIYYSRDSLKKVDGMQRSLSSRMRVYFKNGGANDIFFTSKPEHRYGPLAKFQEDERILKGFIWKPKERPISKESILPSYNRKIARAQATADKKAAAANKGKPATTTVKAAKDSLNNKINVPAASKAGQDSVGTSKAPAVNTSTTKTKQDTLNNKPRAISIPAGKPLKDSTIDTRQHPANKPAVTDTLKGKNQPVIKAKKSNADN